jgi:hypothetical protein
MRFIFKTCLLLVICSASLSLAAYCWIRAHEYKLPPGVEVEERADGKLIMRAATSNASR